jgi:hypothetical protein
MARGNGSSTTHFKRDRLSEITATQVTVEKSAVRSIEAEQVNLEQVAVQRFRAEQAELTGSAIGFARADQATIRQSKAGVVAARSVACDEVHTGVLISPVVRGEVHTWLDMRSAVAIGVGMVLGRAAIAGVRALVKRAAL